MEELKRWRGAKRRFAKEPGMKSATALQRATRNLRIAVKNQLTVIEGGKRETSLRHRN